MDIPNVNTESLFFSLQTDKVRIKGLDAERFISRMLLTNISRKQHQKLKWKIACTCVFSCAEEEMLCGH